MEEHSQELSIELDEKTIAGVYANLAVINHSPTEFVLDFASVMPGLSKARVQSRVVLTPLSAKRLLNALMENVEKFENSNGIIQEEISNAVPIFGQEGRA